MTDSQETQYAPPKIPQNVFISPQKLEAQDRDRATMKPFNNSKTALVKALKLNDVSDLENWLASGLWKPFFDEFLNDWLLPHIRNREEKDQIVSKGPEFSKILEHFAHEESLGTCKFTSARVDKTEWQEIDHYAYLVYIVTNENHRHIDGIFKGKQVTPDERYWQVYQVLVYSKRPFSKSKRTRAEKTKEKKERSEMLKSDPLTPSGSKSRPQPLKSKQLLDLQRTLPESIVTMSQETAELSLGQPTPTADSGPSKRPPSSPASLKFPADQLRHELSSYMEQDGSALQSPKRPRYKNPDRSLPGVLAKESVMQDASPSNAHEHPHTDDSLKRIPGQPDTQLASEADVAKNTGHDDDDGVSVGTDATEPGDAEQAQWLSTTAAILAEMQDSNWDMNLRGWQLAALFTILAEYDNDLHYRQVLTAAGGHDLNLMDAATESWLREIEHQISSQNTWIDAPEVRNEDLVQAREDDKRSRTLETEFDSSKEARDELQLHGDRPRIDGMPRSVYLRFWQIPGVYALWKFQRDFTGCLLADKMGLGKTVMYTAHILQNIKERRRRIASMQTVPAKPKLVLVPANLVVQTINKINSYATNLRVLRYHDDDRRKSTGQISGILEKTSMYFDTEDESNAHTVIVSSHATFAIRHGPNALKKWRELNGYTTASADRLINIKDKADQCPVVLTGKFDIVWVDEADALKRSDSRLNVTMQWLEPDFIGLATATPNRNSLRDSDGYIQLIKPRHVFTEAEREALGVAAPNFNPYAVPKDDPAALFRLKPIFARKFIFDICDSDPIQAGANMAKLNEMIMLRRTHASVIDGQIIGESIPPLIRRRMDVAFSAAAQAWHDRIADGPTRHLVTTDEKGNLIWNAQCFRKLVVYALWPGFEFVERHVYAHTIESWKKVPNLLHDWLSIAHKHLEPEDPNYFELPDINDHLTQIRILCQAAPKIHLIVAMMEQVIRERRKKAFWFLLPAEQLLVWDVLTKLGIDARMFSSDLTADERDKLVYEWNNKSDEPYVLLLVFSMNSQGLDLQTYCNETINVDIPMSRAILESADHRFRRVGQPQDFVVSWNIHIKKTVMDRQVQNNLRKALGNVASEINSSIFRSSPGGMGQAGPNVALDMGRWYVVNQRLVPHDHPWVEQVQKNGDELEELDNLQIILQILREEKGTWAKIKPRAAPATDRFLEIDDDASDNDGNDTA